MHTQKRRWLFMLFTGLITMAAFSSITLASEFSADVIMKGGPMSGSGKVWVKAQKMITIIDLDQGFHCVLMPDSKMYMKIAIKSTGRGFRPENFIEMQQGPMEAQIKRVGTETVQGYRCDKYLITFKNKEMGTMTQWFAIKLNYTIKMINASAMMGEVITELQNIKSGGVKDDLFIIPPGYREMQQPSIPQMPTENQ
jgi:hypothetical protein